MGSNDVDACASLLNSGELTAATHRDMGKYIQRDALHVQDDSTAPRQLRPLLAELCFPPPPPAAAVAWNGRLAVPMKPRPSATHAYKR
jgi:hypothetical protein